MNNQIDDDKAQELAREIIGGIRALEHVILPILQAGEDFLISVALGQWEIRITLRPQDVGFFEDSPLLSMPAIKAVITKVARCLFCDQIVTFELAAVMAPETWWKCPLCGHLRNGGQFLTQQQEREVIEFALRQ